MADPSQDLPPGVVIGILMAGWGLLMYLLLELNDNDKFPPGAA